MSTTRRLFLKRNVLGAAVATIGVGEIARSLGNIEWVRLPTMQGELRIREIPDAGRILSKANAQGYSYHSGGSYTAMAPSADWVAYVMARQRWEMQMAQWYAAQQYQWMMMAHRQRMLQILAQYESYPQVGRPKVYPTAHAVLGFARESSGQPVWFGMTEDKKHVEVKKSLKGASKAWDAIGKLYDDGERESAVVPQSTEKVLQITLPNGNKLLGNGYKTTNRGLGVSLEKVQAEDGRVGNLLKFTTGPDGENYLVI